MAKELGPMGHMHVSDTCVRHMHVSESPHCVGQSQWWWEKKGDSIKLPFALL